MIVLGEIVSLLAPRERALLRVSLPSRALRYRPMAALLADATAVLAAATAAALIRAETSWFGDVGTYAVGQAAMAFPALVAVWLLTIALLGGYSPAIFDAGTEEFRRVAVGTLAAAGALSAICYLVKFPLSRGFFVSAFLLGIPLLFVLRGALRASVTRARGHGSLQHSVLVVGTARSVDDVVRVLHRERRLGYQVAGALTSDRAPGSETSQGVPVLGNVDDVLETVRRTGVDVVMFADGSLSSTDHMRQMAWDLENDEVQVVVAPSVSDVSGDRIRMRPVGGLPMIHIDPPRTTDASRWGKRIFDIVGSSMLLVAALPVLAYAALCIKLHDGGPVIFRQTRVGRNAQDFGCLKLRTMVVDAEARIAALHHEVGFDGGLFKLAQDPRVTKPGVWMRRFSIDELPQLFNVLRGEMSLIGPRPPLPREVAAYPEIAHRRLRVRPGLTGLWQVSGRSNLSFDEAVRLDLYYVDNWSMLQDLSILAKTAGAVLRSRGAY